MILLQRGGAGRAPERAPEGARAAGSRQPTAAQGLRGRSKVKGSSLPEISDSFRFSFIFPLLVKLRLLDRDSLPLHKGARPQQSEGSFLPETSDLLPYLIVFLFQTRWDANVAVFVDVLQVFFPDLVG